MTDFGRRVAIHSTMHEYGGVDEINAALLSGRINFVDRGDPSVFDFEEDDLITDAAWHELDLSSTIPENAIAVFLYLLLRADTVSSLIQFRKPGNSNAENRSRLNVQISGVRIVSEMLVFCDSNRKIEYYASNISFTQIQILAKGWFV